jgi:hypothetical protein
MNEVERDFFDILDDNYEGDIYDNASIFHFEMELTSFPTIDNFYNQLLIHNNQ